MDNNKLKKQEQLFSAILLIVVPIVLFIISYFIVKTSSPTHMVVYSALMFGFGVTTLFNLACIISGLFKGTFTIVLDRVKDFFENASISFKFAIENYFYDLKTGGITF